MVAGLGARTIAEYERASRGSRSPTNDQILGTSEACFPAKCRSGDPCSCADLLLPILEGERRWSRARCPSRPKRNLSCCAPVRSLYCHARLSRAATSALCNRAHNPRMGINWRALVQTSKSTINLTIPGTVLSSRHSMFNSVRRFGPPAFALLAGAIVLLPAMLLGMPKNNDLANHYHFAIPFYEALRQGRFYPGWLATPNFGYGDVVVRFYPPALYYLLAAGRAIMGNWYAGSWLNSRPVQPWCLLSASQNESASRGHGATLQGSQPLMPH